MIIIKKIENQIVWQKFFDENCNQSFLQSWNWGEFQKSLGYDVLRVGVYEKGSLQAITQIIKLKTKRGKFLFLPHGPILKVKSSKLKVKSYLEVLIKYSIAISKKEGFDFIRIAPIIENTAENQKIFKDLGFKTAPIYMHAETTWVLPLTNNTEEELLASMRKTHRYLIKKAYRDGVVVEKTNNPKALNIFYKIYQQTAIREKFKPFSYQYIKKEFEAFNKSKNCLIFLAKINNLTDFNRFQPVSTNFNYLSSALIILTKNAAFYHQGASIHTKIPVTYLLQWEAIKEAKKRGCQFYNFWGIYDENSNRTPKSWQGLTLFKTGFGGQKVSFLPTQDYIVSPKYYLTWLWEKFLMWKRMKIS
jgi:lipid II:glycine glycyltransferase (peptidoglycan interpeptide bridge formation enzyme)